MEIKALIVRGWKPALEGMRLSFNSQVETTFSGDVIMRDLASSDRRLLYKLINEGDSASKCLRFVVAWFDITAPRYWWQQFDTYKIGVERLSASTMHTILKRHLHEGDFEDPIVPHLIAHLNDLIDRKRFNDVKAHLPESFLQRRYVVANYQALRHMYQDRKNHKLKQWHTFCDWLQNNMPYSELICLERSRTNTANE